MPKLKLTIDGGLLYLGADPASDWIAGVPARSLTTEECADLDVPALVASGLYRSAQFDPSVLTTTSNTHAEV